MSKKITLIKTKSNLVDAL